jgi:hypothetical protein
MTTLAESDDSAEDAGGVPMDCQLPSIRQSRVRTWASAALVAVIFFAGLVGGAAGMRFASTPQPADWSGLLNRVAKKMEAKYDLTEAQKASLAQIVSTHQPELNRIYVHTIQEMRTELQQVIEETAAILTPEQASRYRAAVEPALDKHFPPDGATNAPATN